MEAVIIDAFIHGFKQHDNAGDVTWTFLNGYCYYFATILLERFPGGKILYDVIACHFVYMFDGRLYDITGRTNSDGPLYGLEDLEEYDRLVYKRVIRDCVRKE